jgi:hypothetical protein
MELNWFLMLTLLVEHILALSFEECQSMKIYGLDSKNAMKKRAFIKG